MGTVGSARKKGFSTPSSSSSSSSASLLLFLPFFLAFLSLESAAISSTPLNYTKYTQVSSLRLDRIQRHLDTINKPPLLTIQSPDGDIIDCVHKKKQPALDHPLLKNHKIQKVPPEMPKSMKMAKTDAAVTENNSSRNVWQMWHQKGRRCPKGTVPIRRSTVHDVLRAKSLYHFGKKNSKYAAATAAGRRADAPMLLVAMAMSTR